MLADIAAILVVAGRVLIGGFFIAGGLRHFFILKPLSEMVAHRGLPAPTAIVLAGTVWEIAGGALLVAGLHVAPAALSLVVFTIAATIMLVDFWNHQGAERANLLGVFQQNVALVGGLLIAAAGGF